jgi:hypothetical protein
VTAFAMKSDEERIRQGGCETICRSRFRWPSSSRPFAGLSGSAAARQPFTAANSWTRPPAVELEAEARSASPRPRRPKPRQRSDSELARPRQRGDRIASRGPALFSPAPMVPEGRTSPSTSDTREKPFRCATASAQTVFPRVVGRMCVDIHGIDPQTAFPRMTGRDWMLRSLDKKVHMRLIERIDT